MAARTTSTLRSPITCSRVRWGHVGRRSIRQLIVFRACCRLRKGTTDSPVREKSVNVASAVCVSAHFELAQSIKSPEMRRIREKSENNSLSCRLSGGGGSLLRTRLCPQIPVNREIYREFWSLSDPDRAYLGANTGASGFWPEIVTGNEQGNNRRDNRENMAQNRLINCPMQEQGCSPLLSSCSRFKVDAGSIQV